MSNQNLSIVVVAEIAAKSVSQLSHVDFDADRPSALQLADIIKALSKNYDVRFVESREFDPKLILEGEIVLPLWHGGSSRNRNALIPSVCELNGIKYIGADAFVQSTCQDKYASKLIANSFGLNTAKGVVVHDENDISSTSKLHYPVIVKPLYLGSSVGITKDNLCHAFEDSKRKICEMFNAGLGPLLVEEFVVGEEYYVSIIADNERVVHFQAVKWLDKLGKSFLKDKLFDFDLKIKWAEDLMMTECTDEIPRAVRQGISDVCRYFSPIDIMRFDFRGEEENFTLIEITPDVCLAVDAEFVCGFARHMQGPEEVFVEVVNSAIKKHLAKQTNQS